MNWIAKLLPQFVADLPAQARQAVYGALVVVAAILLADYKFAASSGLPWVDSHVVSAAVLAWYVLLATPVLVMAHQRVELPHWEEEIWDAVSPELTNAAAPAADVPNAAVEQILQTVVEPAIQTVDPTAVEPAAPAPAPIVDPTAVNPIPPVS